jgi:hypothetical protein
MIGGNFVGTVKVGGSVGSAAYARVGVASGAAASAATETGTSASAVCTTIVEIKLGSKVGMGAGGFIPGMTQAATAVKRKRQGSRVCFIFKAVFNLENMPILYHISRI